MPTLFINESHNGGLKMYYRLKLTQYNNNLTQALAAIPNDVTSLYLSEIDLDKMSDEQLAQIFSAIPASVTSLTLGGGIV